MRAYSRVSHPYKNKNVQSRACVRKKDGATRGGATPHDKSANTRVFSQKRWGDARGRNPAGWVSDSEVKKIKTSVVSLKMKKDK